MTEELLSGLESTAKVLFTISQPIQTLQLRLLGIPSASREFLRLASMIGSFVHFILYTLIPWDACGTPTVKIRFGCTQYYKASQ